MAMHPYLRDNYNGLIIVRHPIQLQNPRSDVVYFIDGVIDFTGTGYSITVPVDGLTIEGHGVNISRLKCSDNNYDLFVSPPGGSGDLFTSKLTVEVTGANSRVLALTDSDGFHAVECERINYQSCTSLGYLDGYRQALEINTGRFGGTPELELIGNWIGGYRISTSILRAISDITALFKAGTGFVFNGRFITDINADMPTNGALFDFSELNVANNESLIIDGAFVTRNGVLNASDTSLYPNIDHKSNKSNWGNNTGMPNTKKYIKGVCTVEAVTALSGQVVGTYLPLAGTLTVSADEQVQFSSPQNGWFRLETGNGLYGFGGTVQVKGTAGDLVDVRVTKSIDDGVSFSIVINHIQHEIPNFSGPNDFATYSINFNSELKDGDIVRLEVENNTAARDVTMLSDSFFIVTEV